ncbi:AI-2E family transporter [Clostridium sp. CX1]|uniref:AI-2E family transporter n=1 Tax=Clostridium tanneri TaxID=3037988 RepID=A0ABU4JT57_9CLOT|nr:MULTISPECIES: AI-2E family transporter [unclassified Clostridium]MCT8976927.1 AI-2E family transporter [Clostridium sp. CX1]MDW8801134.1 AI-2E family transporter [Clostridium sp. A1-XYC3]
MKKIKRLTVYKYLIVFIIVIILAFLSLKSVVIREIINLLLVSFVISYTLKPLQKVMEQRRIGRRTAALMLICGLILLLVAIFTLLIPSIFKESLNINDTVVNIQKFIDGIYSKLKPISINKTMYTAMDNLYGKINNHIISVFTRIFDAVLNIGENIVMIAVIPIISYYFLSDGEYISSRLLNFLPVRSRDMVKKVTSDIDKILGRYIVSQLFLCGLIGVATFIILLFLKVDFPVILSILNAFFNIVPYFGPIFGAVPAIFIALIDSPEKALWTALWLYILQQIEGNILSPKITGDTVSMHPLIVILLLIIGGETAGFVGMILAVPIGVIIKVIYEDLNYYLF